MQIKKTIWSQRRSIAENNFAYRLVDYEQDDGAETDIVLDVSGSIDEELLKNFLKECKKIVRDSKIRVGCFDTNFHGFNDISKPSDIDKITFPAGGGTDFNVAVGAFKGSKKTSNKIIFTDGYAPMPTKEEKGVIWIVFGKDKINPKGGKVIYIDEEELKKLKGLNCIDNNVISR